VTLALSYIVAYVYNRIKLTNKSSDDDSSKISSVNEHLLIAVTSKPSCFS